MLLLVMMASLQTGAVANEYPPPPGPYRSGPFVPAALDAAATPAPDTAVPKQPGMLLPAAPAGSGDDSRFDAANLFGAAPPAATSADAVTPASRPTPPPDPGREPYPAAYPAMSPPPFERPDAPPDGYAARPAAPPRGGDFSIGSSQRDTGQTSAYPPSFQPAAGAYAGYPPDQAPPFASGYAPEPGRGSPPAYNAPSGYADPSAPYLPTEMHDGYYPVYPDGYASDAYAPPQDTGGGYMPAYAQPYYPGSPQTGFYSDQAADQSGDAGAPALAFPPQPEPAKQPGQAFVPPTPGLAGGPQPAWADVGQDAGQADPRTPGATGGFSADGDPPGTTATPGLRFRPPGELPR